MSDRERQQLLQPKVRVADRVKFIVGVPFQRLLGSLPAHSKILEIGFGNHSPSRVKSMCPTAGYVGIDIQEYNVDAVDAACADELLFVRADRFVDEARERIGSRTFDLVILKHVLEHSSEPMRLVDFVCDACCTGGKLYLAFPSEESISLPPAEGTLNFFDDSTHIYVPAAREVVNRCLANGLRPKAIHRRYRNLPLMLLGAVMFPYQVARRLLLGQYLSTPMMWSLYGFETVLIFEKR